MRSLPYFSRQSDLDVEVAFVTFGLVRLALDVKIDNFISPRLEANYVTPIGQLSKLVRVSVFLIALKLAD